MMAKPLHPSQEKQCGFVVSYKDMAPVMCGQKAVITVGNTPLCKDHGQYVLSVQGGIVCKKAVGNEHYKNCTKSQFLKDNNL